MSEDQQESEAGIDRSAGGGGSCAAGVFASVQSEEVHTAPALCLPGAEGLLQPHLSGNGGAAGGQRFALRGHRAETGAPLHHAAKGSRSIVGEEVVSTADHGHGRAGSPGEDPRPPRPAGRDGHQWLRIASHQPLLCLAAKKGGKTRANVRRLLSPLSQVGCRLRHAKSPLSGGSGQPRATTRLRRLRSLARRSTSLRWSESGSCRRRIRQRSQPRVGPRRVGGFSR